MNFDEIMKRLKDACFLLHEKVIQEPDMRLIIFEVDILCHSIRREFERYENDGIFEIDKLYKRLDKIEDYANKIDEYEEQFAEEE